MNDQGTANTESDREQPCIPEMIAPTVFDCPPMFRMPFAKSALSALVALMFVCAPVMAWAVGLTLTETGSTLMQPLLESWAQTYAKVAPDVQLVTAGSDSGEGVAAVIRGAVLIGASDAYMSDLQMARNPGLLNIPLAISAQTVNYNLPNLTEPLKLSGPVLAGIYAGTIHDWSDPAIAALNPGAALPHSPIVPIRRTDASGDTFIFTQFLSFSTPDWEDGPGFGVSIVWPKVDGVREATGNAGMLQMLAQTPGGIAYIGGSFTDQVVKSGLGTAALQNQDGKFVLPTASTVRAAAAALTPRTPTDERLSLAFAPGPESYPIINYEYAIVRAVQADPAQAAALRDFLLWAITPEKGSAPAYHDPVHFIALPIAIRGLSEEQIAKIH
jgi:phosphate transport system substrate-binding protein